MNERVIECIDENVGEGQCRGAGRYPSTWRLIHPVRPSERGRGEDARKIQNKPSASVLVEFCTKTIQVYVEPVASPMYENNKFLKMNCVKIVIVSAMNTTGGID
eukprot:GHVU01069458.1.p1 GENE.GHVU01069458.1~~GHVU01069458.1.p1  ORF type:complete len:104 (-),score=9.76 GHVU01069458.1:277-588(-)